MPFWKDWFNRPQPAWARHMEKRLMSTLEELNAALGVIGDEVGKVSADVENLLSQLANIPKPGMTPEQQAALDAAVAAATAIRDRLTALDEKVPDAPPAAPDSPPPAA